MSVQAYSSYAYAVEPHSFEHDGTLHRVEKITRSWRTPGEIHFYVRDNADEFFELSYNEPQGEWSIRTFGKSCPPKYL